MYQAYKLIDCNFNVSKATKQHQWSIVILMMIQHIHCKQTLLCHVAVESNLYFTYTTVLLHCIDTVMTRVVFRPFRLMNSYDHHGFLYILFVVEIIWLPLSALLWLYANTCSEWIEAKGTIIDAQIMYSKCMPSVITVPLCTKFQIYLAAPWYVCPTLHSPISTHHSLAHPHPTAVNNKSTIFQGDDDMHDNDDNSNRKVVDNDSNCLRDSSDSNESFSFLNGSSTYEDSKVFFNGLNGHKFYHNSSQDKIGFIPHNTDDIPVPPQFQIPSSCQLNMSPHELELMLFINENFLSPSIFDKVMKWARSATAKGYKFNSPTYSTLKKQMNYTFPNTIKWMVVV